VLGALSIVSNDVHILISLAMIVIGVALWRASRPETALYLRTSSGDQLAYSSNDHDHVHAIKNAIESAIASRP
jgi:hypothetical protein